MMSHEIAEQKGNEASLAENSEVKKAVQPARTIVSCRMRTQRRMVLDSASDYSIIIFIIIWFSD
jgi:hypothetical protein